MLNNVMKVTKFVHVVAKLPVYIYSIYKLHCKIVMYQWWKYILSERGREYLMNFKTKYWKTAGPVSTFLKSTSNKGREMTAFLCNLKSLISHMEHSEWLTQLIIYVEGKTRGRPSGRNGLLNKRSATQTTIKTFRV